MADREPWRAWLEFGNGGWVRYTRSDLPMVVYVRYVDRDSRAEAVEFYVDASDRGDVLSPDLLRQVPIGVISSGVNANLEILRRGLPFPGPDLTRAAGVGFKKSPRVKGNWRWPKTWVDRMLLAQMEVGDEPQVERPQVDRPEVLAVDARLDIPERPHEKAPYPDSFYRAVADVYRRLAGAGEQKPAVVIAEANGVEPTTARRWVKAARDKQFLSKGQRGKVG